MRTKSYYYLAIAALLHSGPTVQSFYINATGGSFPSEVYREATFAYQFLSTGDLVTYFGAGSTTGKCNIMGYWHVGDTEPSQSLIPASVKARDTLICTDACTVATCGVSSAISPRFDRDSREPLVDFAGSDSKLNSVDYAAFPDLQMLPALAGAVVAVYNIPELKPIANNSLILSRQNIADVFQGKITQWNDDRILVNNPLISAVLTKVLHPIKIVVRTDSSGTSEIFSTALSLFDPKVSDGDLSFAGTVLAGSNPKWCGALTDEVQIITISGCNSSHSSIEKQIHFRVVNGTRFIRDLIFACDATDRDLRESFSSFPSGPGLSVFVSKKVTANGVVKFTVGYSAPLTRQKNWYEPTVSSVPTGVSVLVQTFQEGGYLNSHFNATYFVTPQIQSIWIQRALVSSAFNISWHTSSGQVYSVALNSASTSAISSSINAVYAGAVTSVTCVTAPMSSWSECRVTFSAAASASFSTFSVIPLISADSRSISVTTFLNFNNYPLFYDYLHPRGYKGSGRYTCYLRQYNYTAWSYYTGYTNPGIIAEVFTSPYSIGYSVLSDAQVSALPMASLINRAGYIVSPSAVSVAYAVMDRGGNLDAKFNAVLSDGTSAKAWPISGFSYYVIRTNHHIGSCSRRIAAMSYLYNFYTSSTVKSIASGLGYATLPDFLQRIVTNKLVISARCNTGEYALAKYASSPLSLLSPLCIAPAMKSYLSVYNSLGSDVPWDVLSSDDSRSLWSTFISAPDAYVATLTLFSSAAQKLAHYNSSQVITSAFMHVAVVTIYHLDHFSSCANSPLRITNDILSGIYTGSISHWNDSAIQSANSLHSTCLPYQPILVVVRSNTSDANSIFLRYLTIISPVFQNLYSAYNGDPDHMIFNFSSVIPAERLIQVDQNSFVDNEVLSQDSSMGYYLHTAQPASSVAMYCSDRTCSATPIIPNDGGASVSLCQEDDSTVVNPSSNVNSYDLMLSSTAGCYPVVGTIDYSIYSKNNPNTCDSKEMTIDKQKVQLGAFLFNGSAIVKPLIVLSMGSTTTAQRKTAYTNICDLSCNSRVLGYTYCGYNDCSWMDGDYAQAVSSCSPSAQKRVVTYTLVNGANNSCLLNPATIPPAATIIDCPYVMEGSKIAGVIIFMCSFGVLVSGGILYLSWKYRTEKVLKRSQLVFVYIFLTGALAMNWTVMCLYGPNSSTNCMMRVWATNLSSTLMFAPLIMKLHRVDVLFRTLQRGGRRKTISDFTVALQVLGLVSVDITILSLWTVYARPRPVEMAVQYGGTYSPITDYYCSTSLDQPFEKVMVIWKACLLSVGILKSIQTWDVPEEISEAKYFAIAIYNIAVVGSFTYFLSVFGGINVEAVVVLRCVGIFVSSTVSTIVIMVPKLVVIQLSWAEVFLGTKSSCRDDEYSESSSRRTLPPVAAAAVSVPRVHGPAIQLNLEMINMTPQATPQRRL